MLSSIHTARAPLIARGAQLIYSALRKQRTAFIKRATAHLKGTFSESDHSDISGIVSQLPPLALKPSVAKLQIYAGKAGWDAGQAQLGISVEMSVPQRVRDYAAEHSLEQIGADLDQTTVDELRTILTNGLEAETPFSKIVTEIKQAGAFSRQRAETIAVTEIGNAFSQGTLGVAQDLSERGLDMEKSWLAEDEPCDICAGNADQDWIDVDDDFDSGDDAPLAHPNCLCALLVRRAGSEG